MITLRQLFPTWIHTLYMCINTFGYDTKRVLRHCFCYGNDVENKKANLLMVLHTIEKGLTMPEGRCGFGEEKLAQVNSLVKSICHIQPESFELSYASMLLSEYELYHAKRNFKLSPSVCNLLADTRKYLKDAENVSEASQLHFNREDFFTNNTTFSEFAISRHSCRNYSDQPIPKEVFMDVAAIANHAPSSCNRQSCRMHVVSDKALTKKVLEQQGGCRGFGHLAVAAIIVTSDLHSFFDVQERSQPAINSGFFGMNILYALHERGIGACVLNWSNTKKKDAALRHLVPTIRESEQIEFIISCGYPPAEFDVALSQRRSTEDCVCFV